MFHRKLSKISKYPFMVVVNLLTIRPVFILHVELAETEIAKSNVSSVIKQNVFWLQVTVDDVETV